MSMKVLIADPDWRFSQQVCSYLETHAHLVVSESRPTEALDRIKHWGPDLIVLSVEVAEEEFMNSLYALHPRPAVLLTGWMDRYDLAWRAWQRGGDEMLMKPVFRTDELHEAIVTAMENAAAGTRAGSHPSAAAASA